jgi:hypothetical protein
MLAKYYIYVFCMMLAINIVSLSGDITLPAALWLTQPLREIVPRIFPRGVDAVGA